MVSFPTVPVWSSWRTRYNFRMKLAPQKLDGWGYRKNWKLHNPITSTVFTARCYAESGIATAKSSVCPSVTEYRDHINWNFSKIISPLLRLGSSLSADLNIVDLLQGQHPEILGGIGEGYRKSGFRLTKAVISLKRGKIGPGLLLRTKRKSYARFRLVAKSTTLDDL